MFSTSFDLDELRRAVPGPDASPVAGLLIVADEYVRRYRTAYYELWYARLRHT